MLFTAHVSTQHNTTRAKTTAEAIDRSAAERKAAELYLAASTPARRRFCLFDVVSYRGNSMDIRFRKFAIEDGKITAR